MHCGHYRTVQLAVPILDHTCTYTEALGTEAERGTPEPRRTHLRSLAELTSETSPKPRRRYYQPPSSWPIIIIVCWVSACASLGRGDVRLSVLVRKPRGAPDPEPRRTHLRNFAEASPKILSASFKLAYNNSLLDKRMRKPRARRCSTQCT